MHGIEGNIWNASWIKHFCVMWLCMPLYLEASHRGISVTPTVGSYREQAKQKVAQWYVADISILISAKLKQSWMGLKMDWRQTVKKLSSLMQYSCYEDHTHLSSCESGDCDGRH